MPAFFIELFSEEIPARLQQPAALDLQRLLTEALAPIGLTDAQPFYGPRRIALAATVDARVPPSLSEERGPRITAPEQAVEGFLRKHGAQRDALKQSGDFWLLEKSSPAIDAASLVAGVVPSLLWRFPWPKSMRWGGTSAFTWIRPLRRIVCLLDDEVVPFVLAQGGDDGHRLASGNLTEGHRVHEPSVFAVTGWEDWRDKLFAHRVMVRARAQAIAGQLAQGAAERGLHLVEDPGLVDEVAGLVEWVVPRFGRIDDAFMDLPPEVMQVSMRVNQRYFATRTAGGAPAPWFAFVANLQAPDGGAAIVAGNERVLRARFSDARHFWDLDRRTKLADRVAALDGITFQAELGSQGDRVRRMEQIAGVLCMLLGGDIVHVRRAAVLAKADLTTGMVGEFPELQGVMGAYYAQHDGEHPLVCEAIRDHYGPKGLSDTPPSAPLAIIVALADKIDQLTAFFSVGQKPTGSGDPFALRRAALGILRILRENGIRVPLLPVLQRAAKSLPHAAPSLPAAVLDFIIERLRVQLRTEGARHDVLTAVFASRTDDDLVRALAKSEAIAALLDTDDGSTLLGAYKRASNILRIEDKKDGPYSGMVDIAFFRTPEEHELSAAMAQAGRADMLLAQEKFAEAMTTLAELRRPLDAFFDKVTVNAEDRVLRRNRLNLLAALRASLNRVADFSAIAS